MVYIIKLSHSGSSYSQASGTSPPIKALRQSCHWVWGLTHHPDYKCAWCMGNARPIYGRPQSEAQVWPDNLEMAASFCYLSDMISAGEGCEITVTNRVFRELLLVLTSRNLSYKTRCHVYSFCVRIAMLHASETWPLTKTKLGHWPRRTCSAMIGPWSDRSAGSSQRMWPW